MSAPHQPHNKNAPPNHDASHPSPNVEATSPTAPISTLSREVEDTVLVAYRSIGIGTFGVVMRFAGMPLEKIALFMNSSQVTGANPIRQSVKLTFSGGWLAPYRVVGPASLVSWFMAYSVMGLAFQTVDHALSKALGVKPVWYGDELMLPPPSKNEPNSTEETLDATYRIKSTFRTILAPILAGSVESVVANRAEVQRYFGPEKFASIESKLAWKSPISRLCAPAYLPNVMRNVIMCSTSFIMTPITYRLFYPQEKKSKSSLFWYGMGMNFMGNSIAITQQALWGRSLDYCAENGGRNINYGEVIRNSYNKEGMKAFFTFPKWGSRILMNAPVQGSLPWFYNNVLPLGEAAVLDAMRWATTSTPKNNAPYSTPGTTETKTYSS